VSTKGPPPPTGLPPPNTRRWVASRKAAIVTAVSNAVISLEEACRRYQISKEEFLAWRRSFETYGVKGLQVTTLQDRRSRTTQPVSSKRKFTAGRFQ